MSAPAALSLSKLRADWLAANPNSDNVPEWLRGRARALTPARHAGEAAALDARRCDLDDHLNRAEPVGGKHRLTYRQRVKVSRQLARRMKEWAVPELGDLPDRLSLCHTRGHGGEDAETGDLVVAWEHKCGNALACPHCSRAEGRRLVRRNRARAWLFAQGRLVEVKRQIEQRAKGGARTVTRATWCEIPDGPMARQIRKRRRIIYGVLTWPNIAPGRLAEFLRAMPRWVARLSDRFPAIKGRLVVLEDPPSKHDDWNLHANVLWLIEGWLDFGEVRRAWAAMTRHLFPAFTGSTFDTEFKRLPDDPDKLDAALRELIKYPVKHVTEKSNTARAKDRAASDVAPALVDLSRERFVEWWRAHKSFRRTRSGGALFRVPKEEKRAPRAVLWRWSVAWEDRAQAFVVYRTGHGPLDLIQGDKSPRRTTHNSRAGPPPTGSPIVTSTTFHREGGNPNGK